MVSTPSNAVVPAVPVTVTGTSSPSGRALITSLLLNFTIRSGGFRI